MTIKLTLPRLPEGATRWRLYQEYQAPIGRDPWPWQHRIVWRVMMWAHGHVERLWHWLYYASRRFAEPRMKTETRYRELETLKVEGGNVTVKEAPGLVNGAPLLSRIPE